VTTADRKRSLESVLGSAIRRTKEVQSATRAIGVEIRSGETETGEETDTVISQLGREGSRDNDADESQSQRG